MHSLEWSNLYEHFRIANNVLLITIFLNHNDVGHTEETFYEDFLETLKLLHQDVEKQF